MAPGGRIRISTPAESPTVVGNFTNTPLVIKIKLNKMQHIKYLIVGLIIFSTACNNKQQNQSEATLNPTEQADTVQKIETKLLSGKVEFDNIPSQAKKFIEKNYNAYKISNAAYDPLCSGGNAIDVAITQKGKPNYSLIFLTDGTFVQQEEDIELSMAPQKVIKTTKEKFSDYKIANQIERLTLSDKSVQYLLDLTKGSETMEVILSENGSIVCESKE